MMQLFDSWTDDCHRRKSTAKTSDIRSQQWRLYRPSVPLLDLPEYWNWKELNVVTGVKNQVTLIMYI